MRITSVESSVSVSGDRYYMTVVTDKRQVHSIEINSVQYSALKKLIVGDNYFKSVDKKQNKVLDDTQHTVNNFDWLDKKSDEDSDKQMVVSESVFEQPYSSNEQNDDYDDIGEVLPRGRLGISQL